MNQRNLKMEIRGRGDQSPKKSSKASNAEALAFSGWLVVFILGLLFWNTHSMLEASKESESASIKSWSDRAFKAEEELKNLKAKLAEEDQ